MILIDLIEFNKELLQRLKDAGIRLEDYKYCDLYRSYLELSKTMQTRKEVILTLAEMEQRTKSLQRPKSEGIRRNQQLNRRKNDTSRNEREIP